MAELNCMRVCVCLVFFLFGVQVSLPPMGAAPMPPGPVDKRSVARKGDKGVSRRVGTWFRGGLAHPPPEWP